MRIGVFKRVKEMENYSMPCLFYFKILDSPLYVKQFVDSNEFHQYLSGILVGMIHSNNAPTDITITIEKK